MRTVCSLLVFYVPCLAVFSGGNVFGATLFTNPSIPASEKQGMELIYQLNIPAANPNWRNGVPVPYTIDNSALFAATFASLSNRRVGYYMEVGSEYAFVSMNSFDTNLGRIGYPHNVNNPIARQTIVTGANVYSNDPGITNVINSSTVNLEMWPSNYGQGQGNVALGGSGSTFDWNDNGFNTSAGHGSFQIHNYGLSQVLFGHNNWAGNNVGQNSELGIGTFGGANPDWTFSNTASAGFLQIVALVPEPSRAILLLGGAMLLGLRRGRSGKVAHCTSKGTQITDLSKKALLPA